MPNNDIWNFDCYNTFIDNMHKEDAEEAMLADCSDYLDNVLGDVKDYNAVTELFADDNTVAVSKPVNLRKPITRKRSTAKVINTTSNRGSVNLCKSQIPYSLKTALRLSAQ